MRHPAATLALLVATAFGAAATPSAAWAEKPKATAAKEGGGKGKKEAPMSVGAPNQGKLRGAKRLRVTDDVITKRSSSTWALPELTDLLQRAARKVRKKHGGPALLVGDLSAKGGGPLVGHNSHQSGRDADIGFFVTNSKGKPFRAKRFLPFDDQGQGKDVPWARFDDARNWAFLRALLTDDKVTVRYVFVTPGLEARLLAYAKKKDEPAELLTRAAAVMMSPKDADVHDDHFHIRIACPEAMRGTCVEESRASVPSGGEPKDAGDAADPYAATAPSKAERPTDGVAALAERAAREASDGDAPKAPAAPAKREGP